MNKEVVLEFLRGIIARVEAGTLLMRRIPTMEREAIELPSEGVFRRFEPGPLIFKIELEEQTP